MYEKEEKIALFWHEIIKPLLAPGISADKRREIIRKVTGKTHDIPYSVRITITEANIKKKLYLYRRFGFQGLKQKQRSDKGGIKAVPQDVLDAALKLKRELPSRSVRKIIRMLKSNPDIPFNGRISIATLSRHFKKMGYTRKLLENPDSDVFTMFRYEKINQLWQGDAMAGPVLPHPEDGRRSLRTKLLAFKDDCSALIPGGRFYPDETLPSMEDCLKHAILHRGLPHAIYVDNARVYHAEQFKLILAELSIRLYHQTCYRPQGKGKIESFFAYVQSDFVPEAKAEIKAGNIQTLAELNTCFAAWLEISYHHKVHTVLKKTPISIWCEQQDAIKYADPIKLDEIFLWRYNRHVSKHATFTIEGNLYEAAPEMKDKDIQVRFNPYELDKVYIYEGGRFLMKAAPTDIKTIQSEKVKRKIPDKQEKTLSVSYLALVLQQYKKMAKDKMDKISFAALQKAKDGVEKKKTQWVEKFQEAINVKVSLTVKNTLLGLYEQFGEQLNRLLPALETAMKEENITFDGKDPVAFSKIINLLRKAVLNGGKEQNHV
jgi:putative transposase